VVGGILAAVGMACALVAGPTVASARGIEQSSRSHPRSIPNGWRTYSYGWATISVPAAWAVRRDTDCPTTTAPGALLLGASKILSGCVLFHYQPHFVALTSIPAGEGAASLPTTATPTEVNGVPVYVLFGSPISLHWEAPSLGVALAAAGPDAERILHTLRARRPREHAGSGTTLLPAVVNGVPLLALARHAVGAAEGYAVSQPAQVRAVVSTEAALWDLASRHGGSPSSVYIVTLRGRFDCGACGTAMTPAAPPTTTVPRTVPVATMVLEIPMPISQSTNAVYVGVGHPDLSKLGHVYDLDPYVRSLAGVSVRIGPLPG
jgi:hypothetical protein